MSVVPQTPPVRTYGRLASFAEGVVGVSLHEARFANTPRANDDDLEFKISGPGGYLLAARLSSEGRGRVRGAPAATGGPPRYVISRIH